MLESAKLAGFFAAHAVNGAEDTDDGVITPLGGTLGLGDEKSVHRFGEQETYEESVDAGLAFVAEQPEGVSSVLIFNGFIADTSIGDDPDAKSPVLIVDFRDGTDEGHAVFAIPFVIDEDDNFTIRAITILNTPVGFQDAETINTLALAFFEGVQSNETGFAAWLRTFRNGDGTVPADTILNNA